MTDFSIGCVSSGKLPLCAEGGNSKITNPVTICPHPGFSGKALTVLGDVNITGAIDPTAVGFTESITSPLPLEAGIGVLWVRNDAPNTLIFTDDGGTDHDLLATGGDVSGPVSATDTAIARFDGITGDQITDSVLALDGSGDIDRSGSAYLHERGGTFNFGAGSNALSLIAGGQQDNTGIGQRALFTNAIGSQNTAVGTRCMEASSGSSNTGVGHLCLVNTASTNNTGIGQSALNACNTGSDNTGCGQSSLFVVFDGDRNTAVGQNSLGGLVGGDENTAIGQNTLTGLVSGDRNIAIGVSTGIALTGTDSDNILINNSGVVGDNNAIRVGTSQTSCFVQGIRGVATGVADAVPVLVDSTGQIGTVSSSIRYKRNVKRLVDEDVNKFLELNPVSFLYKHDPTYLQYGLIAEEVEEIIPELVSYEGETVESVKYHLLHAFYIKTIQQLSKRIDELEEKCDC